MDKISSKDIIIGIISMNYIRKVYSDGVIRYYNTKGMLHREDGPAVECPNDHKEWYINGQLHREDCPAIELTDGRKQYWFNDRVYRNIASDEEWQSLVIKIKLLG
jgi:hypothetical protein